MKKYPALVLDSELLYLIINMDPYFLKIQLSGSLRWLIQHNNKSTYNLGKINENEVHLINPNFYGGFKNEYDYFRPTITKKGILIECSLLYFKIKGTNDIKEF